MKGHRFTRRLLAGAVATLVLAIGGTSSAQAASPAWQPVGGTGPTVLPPVQSEVQSIFVDAEAGSYTLSLTTVSASVVSTAGSPVVNVLNVAYGKFEVGAPVTLEAEVLDPELAPGTTIESCSPSCDTPTSVTLSNPVEGLTGFFAETLSQGGTTAAIPYAAPAAGSGSVEEALSALPGVAGAVSVIGGPGGPGGEDPYSVSFGGALADTNLGQLAADASGLSGAGESAVVTTTVDGGKGTSILALYAQNIGGAAASGPVTFKVTLPPGVTTVSTPTSDPELPPLPSQTWSCSEGAGQTEFTCTLVAFALPPAPPVRVEPSYVTPALRAEITAAPGSEGGTIHAEVEGGGAPAADFELPLTVGTTPAGPGLQVFEAGAFDDNGAPDTRAGGHPYSASTAIFANTKRSVKGFVIPSGDFKDILVDLPPGFVGNPTAVPQCPESVPEVACPLDTMVGVVKPLLSGNNKAPGRSYGDNGWVQPVYNTEAPYGSPAKFRFNIAGANPLNATGSLRSDGDYGITVASRNTPQVSQVVGVFFTFWGAPADPSLDATRCTGRSVRVPEIPIVCENGEGPVTAFLTSPTNCAEQALTQPITFLRTNTWQNPGEVATREAAIPPVTGCGGLKLETGLSFQPAGAVADSPASFSTRVTMPSEGLTDPAKLVNPELKDSVVMLPEGVSLNPAAADGLAACSLEQIGFLGSNFPMPNPIRFNLEPNRCPDASKIGTLELKTALLEAPLQGAVYLAEQDAGNPFGSLFALYLVIEDPRHGIFIKLPGRADPNEKTGQLKVTFSNLPQLPFTSLDLKLKGGSRAPLATPTTCGSFTSTATNTPWSAPESGPAEVVSDSFNLGQAPNGKPCPTTPAERPFDLGLNAGSTQPLGGATSPFQIQITRPDGSQELDRLEISPPAGLVASLRGVPYCSEAQIAAARSASSGRAERSAPSCPQASEVGSVQAGAGAGATPFYVPGKLYLAGPYQGAPLSVVAITPAVAGPFDLGNVVIRSALRVDPTTARITAVTDPLPQIFEGIPLRIRDIRIDLDRSNWTQNPTSCKEMAVDATAFGTAGAVSKLSNRFQVAGCGRLKFKPKLRLQYKGQTKRSGFPALRAVLTQPRGQANISRTAVILPRGSFIANAHVNNPCTRAQYAANACPRNSILGKATAWSPLLDEPLTGNVYFRSNGGVRQLPDIVASLKGQVDVELVGFIDAIENKKAGTSRVRNTFAIVPDAPVSRFVLNMKGGKVGLIENSRNLCAGVNRATVKMKAHNGRKRTFNPIVRTDCKRKKKSTKKPGR